MKLIFFNRNQGGTVWGSLADNNTIPTKPPISKQQSPTQEKQEAINQRAFSKIMLLLK